MSRASLLAVFAALVAVLCAPGAATGTARSAQEIETLTMSDARYYMSKALGDEFGAQYRYRVGGSIKCRRSTDTRARCAIKWGIGDAYFGGVGYLWYELEDGETVWNYSWKLRRIDYYCRSVLKKPLYKCSKRYVMR